MAWCHVPFTASPSAQAAAAWIWAPPVERAASKQMEMF